MRKSNFTIWDLYRIFSDPFYMIVVGPTAVMRVVIKATLFHAESKLILLNGWVASVLHVLSVILLLILCFHLAVIGHYMFLVVSCEKKGISVNEEVKRRSLRLGGFWGKWYYKLFYCLPPEESEKEKSTETQTYKGGKENK